MAKPDDDKEIYGVPLELPETSPRTTISKPKRNHRKRIVILLIILLLVSGGLIYYFFLRPKSANQPTANNTPTSSADTESSKSNVEYKKHTSDFPRMELTYPSTWTVVEKENGVIVSSPDFSYTTVDKGVVKGNFSVYIRQGARQQEGKYIGRGMAIRPTEKLTYAAPSTTQRKDTNLTLFGLDSSDHFSFFLVSGDYELKSDETLGPEYGKEAETYIIAGGYGSLKQTDPLEYNSLSVNQATKNEAYIQGLAIVQSLKVY